MKKLFSLLTAAALVLVGCDSGDDGSGDPDGTVTINGVKWATRNVDAPGEFADKPEDFGMFYQWGRNVGWSVTNPLVSSPVGETWEVDYGSGQVWESVNDPCPDGWRVPSREDLNALRDNSKVVDTWTKQDGVDGRQFVDKITGKSIFLPASGGRASSGGIVGDQDLFGYYWSSTVLDSDLGYLLRFHSTNVDPLGVGVFAAGYAVRCVRK